MTPSQHKEAIALAGNKLETLRRDSAANQAKLNLISARLKIREDLNHLNDKVSELE